MTNPNVRELCQEDLDAVTGGNEAPIGERAQWAICPTCMCALKEGTFTRPEFGEEYNPMLKKSVPIYAGGFICPKCGYTALASELPYFEKTADGLKPVTN